MSKTKAMSSQEAVNMRDAFEYLPATKAADHAATQNVVLLHGWGADREFWRPLVRHLRPWANLTLVDIHPCFSQALDWEEQITDTVETLLAGCPGRSIFVGFSLGGKLALEAACRAPECVAGVVTICTNPSFVATTDWPGMSRAEFDEFQLAVRASPETALKRFDGLQAQGSQNKRALLRELRQRRGMLPVNLDTGLDWLSCLDQRKSLLGLSMPQCHFFALSDALVPVEVADALEALEADGGLRVERFADSSHLLPWEAPEVVSRQIRVFLTDSGLLERTSTRTPEVSKEDVAASFSRAATRYDSVAVLQQDVGRRLLAALDDIENDPATILDLGCGTGYFSEPLKHRFPAAQYIGLDIAEGMVEYARGRSEGSQQWLVGDAEVLPFATGSVDLMFSSLALQWCYQPQLLFTEIARVLAPQGLCVFTSLGPGTLQELRESWAAVDAHQHVNSFLTGEDLVSAAEATAGVRLNLELENVTMKYARVRDLLDELKTLGAHNMNRSRPHGLTSRRTLQGMLHAYEAWRSDGLLPATYEVIFGTLERT